MAADPPTLIPEAIGRAAQRDPDHPALRMAGDGLSYGELEERSNRVANMLLSRGVRKGDRVGLYAHKSLDLLVALFGVMKAGAAYVPINPDAPAAYVRHIVEDCEIRHCVVGRGTRRTAHTVAEATGIELLVGIEEEIGATPALGWDDVWAHPATPPPVRLESEDLAYIIFTSGSTGRPKGIMHTHASGLAYGMVGAAAYGFHAGDRIANHAPLNFDLSLLELWGGLVAGATIVIIPESHARLPASLSQMLADERVTVINAVPFALVQLLHRGALDQRDLSALRWVIFGGEVFPTKDLRALMRRLPQARFANVYGPAEVNGVTYYVVPDLPGDSDEPISIGSLYPGMRAMVLDANGAELPDGATGELVVNSPTHMVGYWRQPELTARCTHTAVGIDGTAERWHRTGDLVQRVDDGRFRLIGRKDRLVKTRGHRVELDEVENALLTHPDVEQAVVFTVPDDEGSQDIFAVVVLDGHSAAEGATEWEAELRQHAGRLLPRYAIPRAVRVADSVPRTSTGKADRIALAADAARVGGGQ